MISLPANSWLAMCSVDKVYMLTTSQHCYRSAYGFPATNLATHFSYYFVP